MALSIKHPEADRLARELAKRTGEGLTEAVIQALRERLDRTKKARPSLSDALLRIGRACALLPVLDGRSADDILGYGDGGLPE